MHNTVLNDMSDNNESKEHVVVRNGQRVSAAVSETEAKRIADNEKKKSLQETQGEVSIVRQING